MSLTLREKIVAYKTAVVRFFKSSPREPPFGRYHAGVKIN